MKQNLSRHEIERMCLAHLRMLLRSQHITRVVVAAKPDRNRNWALVAVEPALLAREEHEARTALAGLQEQFRLTE